MAAHSGKVYTWEEVAEHNSLSTGVWVVIDGFVYDVTRFVDEHPGGDDVLLDNAGGDATNAFQDVGHSADAINLRETFLIGRIATDDSPSESTASPTSQVRTLLGVAAGVALPALTLLAVAVGAYLIYRRYKQ